MSEAKAPHRLLHLVTYPVHSQGRDLSILMGWLGVEATIWRLV